VQLPVQPESSAAVKTGKELMPLGTDIFEAVAAMAEPKAEEAEAMSCCRMKAV
jgi:hypothetical protein